MDEDDLDDRCPCRCSPARQPAVMSLMMALGADIQPGAAFAMAGVSNVRVILHTVQVRRT